MCGEVESGTADLAVEHGRCGRNGGCVNLADLRRGANHDVPHHAPDRARVAGRPAPPRLHHLQRRLGHGGQYEQRMGLNHDQPEPAQLRRRARGPDSVHQIEHDGYRLMARRDPIGIRLLPRNGHRAGSMVLNCRPKMERRPTLRPAGLLLFPRFRSMEQPKCLRGTIEHRCSSQVPA